ncbi:hypothetical protein [Conexibacter sp. SYSU D00693]|uniref:hypothetical protein n=1 Tax=Conexibacter sp. SYSU D00693 TaxID=2812560 RepID=UPI00196AB143|nr:hypothetical protein [Conexibacter sp. SYSU D00693]
MTRTLHSAGLGALALAASAAAVATVAAQSSAQGGLSISPAIVERPAAPGRIGTVVVTNSSSATFDVVATARPWSQARSGTVLPDARRTLSQVRLGATRFTLAPGQRRTIDASLTSVPAAGSLYGTVEVLGTPRGGPGGVRTRLRLLSSLRLNPAASRRRLRVRVGEVRARGGRVTVAVRNTGNTVQPLTGSIRVAGAAGTLRGTVAAQRILPGAVVDVRAARGRLQRGSYRATVVLRQGGRRVASTTRTLRVG